MKLTRINYGMAGIAIFGASMLAVVVTLSQAQQPPESMKADTKAVVTTLTQVLGRPTDHSITLSVLAPDDMDAYIEYGVKAGSYPSKVAAKTTKGGVPVEFVVDKLKPNTHYSYRLRYRKPGAAAYTAGEANSFQTQRPAGSSFVFGVEGDSHPERVNRMYDAAMFDRTLAQVRGEKPDFYIALGDDFSVDTLTTLTPEVVNQLYINQRAFFGKVASSAPLFLVNGNHEQAAKYLLDGTPNNVAVWAGKARNLYYPQPEPDGFYTGDTEPVQFVGLRRDYYAWTWGDALFVTIDPYWQSPTQVGTEVGFERPDKDKSNRKGAKNGYTYTLESIGWGSTLGDAQYKWLKKTLEESHAKYKFIFTHLVMGIDRGGIKRADLYEWGGKNHKGEWEFDKMRPGWELPIHQLMVKTGVTIFFQGHDHLFAHEVKDGIVYQETPNPADPSNSTPFPDAYAGDILPGGGHLRVSVTPDNVKVDYIRSYLPKDETPAHKQGEVAYSYAVKPRK